MAQEILPGINWEDKIMKKCFYLFAGVLICAISCQIEPINDSEVEQIDKVEAPVNEGATRIITLKFSEAPDSKVSLTQEDGVGKTRWEENDEIFIHGKKVGQVGESYYSRIVTLKSSDIHDDGKTATFTLGEIEEPHSQPGDYHSNLYVEYPASAVSNYTDGDGSRYYNHFKNTNQLLLAGCNDETVNDGNTFYFFACCGALSFIVSGDFDQYIFSGNNNEAIGYTHYVTRIQNGNSSSDKRIFNQTTEGPLTSISVTGWTGADGSTVNYVYFPNGANFTSGFKIQFLKEGVVQKVLSTHTPKNIARESYLPLGNVTAYIKTPPADHTELSGELKFDSAVDLSEGNGSANCYIISSAGQYKLPCVQGNGSNSVGSVGGASLLWETYNNNTEVVENSVIEALDYYVSGDAKYLVFKTPSTLKPGNALIAATNSGGVVLWSWHIWIPETAITTSTYGGITTAAMMSRNLGALVDAEASSSLSVESYGLMYCWGRKDPFPGPSAVGTGSIAAISGSIDWAGSIVASSEVYKYPNVFVKTGGDDSSSNKDWCSDHSSLLWGASKTIYDPCPPTYRVPHVGDGGIWNESASWSSLTGWDYNISEHWAKLGVAYNDANPSTTGYVVFPYVGFIQQYDAAFSGVGKRAYYWTATGGTSAYASVFYGDSGAISYVASQRKGRAGSVRCVAE